MADVVDLILSDHREVERLFAVLTNEPAKRSLALPELTTLLTAHSRAEEAEVYPAAAAAGGAEDVEHSQKEHLEAEQILARLAGTDPGTAEFEERLQELVAAVGHHIEEEEGTVLPGMREHLDADRLAELADRFSAKRSEILGARPDDVTREQLLQQARNIHLEGASGKPKDELAAALRDKAER